MIDLFLLKVILSFFVGGLYTIIATVAADKFGSKIGGLIGGLPSTALFGLFFIGWTQNSQASAEATTLIPASLGISCLFIVAYIYLVKYNVWCALFGSIVLWGTGAYMLVALHITNFFVSIVLFCILYCIGYLVVTRVFTITASKGNTIIYSPGIILFRGFISGFIVALSVFVAKIGGPVLGGMFASFPAMFTSTFLITYFAHGAVFSSAVAKNSLFALVSIVIFVVVARYVFVPFGIVWGSLISLAVSYLCAYFLYTFIVKKHA